MQRHSNAAITALFNYGRLIQSLSGTVIQRVKQAAGDRAPMFASAQGTLTLRAWPERIGSGMQSLVVQADLAVYRHAQPFVVSW